MASSATQSRPNLKAAAFAAALLIHALWLILLMWVRPVLSTREVWTPEDLSNTPIEVGLVPGDGSGDGASAGGAAGSPGEAGGLRPLRGETGGSAAPSPDGLRGSQTPVQSAPQLAAPPTLETHAAAAASSPVPPSQLSPQQPLTPAPAEPAPPPTLALRPSIETTGPLTAASRPLRPAELRPAPSLAVESEPATLAPRLPALQTAPALTATVRPMARPELRPAPSLAAAAPEPPPTLAGRPQALQAPAVTAAAKPSLRPELQPSPSLADLGPPPTLAARPAALQAPPSIAAAAARPGPRTDLRPPAGLAGLQTGSSPFPAPGPATGQANGAAAGAAGTATAQNGAGSGTGPGRGAGGGHPGCAPEDLILLTPAEKERCRNAIAAANAHRANSNADAEIARRVHMAMGAPRVDGIPPEKRAYYDAVAAANDAVHNQVGGGKAPGLACNFAGLFGGGAGAPTEKIKIPGLPCSFIPPVGVLTEETRVSPP